MAGRGEGGADPGSAPKVLRPEPLLSTIVSHDVEFIVVGGYAVAVHGFIRATKDIDICPAPTRKNLERLAAALEELEATPIGLDEFAGESDLKPDIEGLRGGGNWTLMTRYGRLDVMQQLEGLGEDGGGWDELRPHAIREPFLGYDCLFCGYEDLIRMKEAAGRAQDEIDIQSLKAARYSGGSLP